jgi:hypothetical protein
MQQLIEKVVDQAQDKETSNHQEKLNIKPFSHHVVLVRILFLNKVIQKRKSFITEFGSLTSNT